MPDVSNEAVIEVSKTAAELGYSEVENGRDRVDDGTSDSEIA